MYKLCLILLLITINKSYFIEGTTKNPQYAVPPQHILHSSNEVDRALDMKIIFPKSFESQPKVAIFPKVLDYAYYIGGYDTQIKEITQDYFIFQIIVFSDKPFYSALIQWCATDDPDFHVFYHPILNIQENEYVDGQYHFFEEYIDIEIWESLELEQKQQYSWIFQMMGYRQIEGYLLYLFLYDSDTIYEDNQIYLSFQTNFSCIISELYLQIIIVTGPKYTIQFYFGHYSKSNEFFYTRPQPTKAIQKIETDILPIQFQYSNSIILVGILLSSQAIYFNTRVGYENCKITDKLSCEVYTWSNSRTIQVSLSAIIYHPLIKPTQELQCFLDPAKTIPCEPSET